MQTTKVFAETAHWLRYAEEDLITAETLSLLQQSNVSIEKEGIFSSGFGCIRSTQPTLIEIILLVTHATER